jgi:hypothetical protein
MEFTQILIVVILSLIVVSFFSIFIFIYFFRSKKVIMDNHVISNIGRKDYVIADNFSRESVFKSLLRHYIFITIWILGSLTLVGIVIYVGWHYDFIKNILSV